MVTPSPTRDAWDVLLEVLAELGAAWPQADTSTAADGQPTTSPLATGPTAPPFGKGETSNDR